MVLILTACIPAALPIDKPPTLKLIPTTTAQPNRTPTPIASIEPTIVWEDFPPYGAPDEFITDFSIHSVPYNKVHFAGPGKDGIPAIDFPVFVSIEEADEWIEPQEPVIVVRAGGDARAYPLQILVWHEVVNDVVDGRPLVITYCPLCNTGIAFDRTVGGTVLDFGTTGRLYNSNLLMYDRLTESWWQQATGQAVIGEYTGAQLDFFPVEMVTWQDFKENFPGGLVLSRDTGEYRRYDLTPYHLYDGLNKKPYFYYGPKTSAELPSMTRVLAVKIDNDAVAYPYTILEEIRTINDTIGGEPIVLFWSPGAVSVLDKYVIANSREVGSAVGFSRVLEDRVLSFRIVDGRILDSETGSEWDILGRAIRGPLSGMQLESIVATNHFWFSWYAFYPETRIYPP